MAESTLTLELGLKWKRWAMPSLTAFAWVCGLLSFVLPHRAIDWLANGVTSFVAHHGMIITINGNPQKRRKIALFRPSRPL